MSDSGSQIHLTAWDDEALVLLCHGDVIDEPVVAHGPFVMNTEAEIREAFMEYQSGQFGRVVGVSWAQRCLICLRGSCGCKGFGLANSSQTDRS